MEPRQSAPDRLTRLNSHGRWPGWGGLASRASSLSDTSLPAFQFGGVAGQQDAQRAVEALLGVQPLPGDEGPGEVGVGGPVQGGELRGLAFGALVVGGLADLAQGVAEDNLSQPIAE